MDIDIEKKFERLEERVGRGEERIATLDKSVAVYSTVAERTLQIQEKLSVSIDRLSETTIELQNTLVRVQSDIKYSSEEQKKNMEKVEKLEGATNKRLSEIDVKWDEKLKELAKGVREVDNRGKFDVIKFIRDNFVTILIFAFSIYEAVIIFQK